MSNICMTCKFADWKRTAAGRLHPDGQGRCRWQMPEITLPKAFYYVGYHSTPKPSGGQIERKHDDERECAAWLLLDLGLTDEEARRIEESF